MQLGSTFSARTVQPALAEGSANWAVGRVPSVITDSTIKQTQDQTGGYIDLTCTAIDGPEKGTMMHYRLNIFSQNAQARDIAQRQLSSLCHVTGVYDVSDTSQLHGIPFIAVVKPNPTEKYPNGTQIGGSLDMAGNDPGKSAGPAPVAAAPAAPAFIAKAQPQPAQATAPAPTAWAPPSGAVAPAAAPAQAWATPPAAAPANGAAPSWVTPR